MKTSLACVPCLVRQSMDALDRCDATPEAAEMHVREILLAATALDFAHSPPRLAGELQAQLRDITGCADPFREAKKRHNRLAAELIPPLAEAAACSEDPFASAVRLAIAGNVIDLGAKSGLTEAEVRSAAREALARPLCGDLESLRGAAASARNILYLADNAGEIVFDTVLIKQLRHARVTVAVRGSPVLNDATREDAEEAGIRSVAELIDNGSAMPGTVLADCSASFRRLFASADLVLAKGQGNFETLDEADRRVFCLFRVKCPLVAEHCGHPVGSHVVWQAGQLQKSAPPS